MKTVKFIWLLAGALPLLSCNSHIPEIRTLCLRDEIGNYIIKWETDPQIEGTVQLYVSDNPDSFDRSSPAASVDIKEGVTTYVTNDNITRQYFLLSFNNKYLREVASRSVTMDSIQNFRDMGGYISRDSDKMVRWGMVYRSGKVCILSERDLIRLDKLNIRTMIDLRTDEEIAGDPVQYTGANIIHIPIEIRNYENMYNRLQEGETRKGDAVVFMQDLYLHYATEDTEQFAKALTVFEDKENYPIVFNCSYGKDRAGFLAALLLMVLDIPEEEIVEDYLASNEYLDRSFYAPLVHGLNTDGQETLTALLTANESYLDLAIKRIKKDYGSIDKYLTKELKITEAQQKRIKEILLF